MKKIIMSLMCCLCVYSVVPMEKGDFAIVPFDEHVERTPVVSYEGLCVLATELQGKWNDVELYYDVKPVALAEYVSYVDMQQKVGVDQQSLQDFQHLYRWKYTTYARVVEQIMDEICQQKLGRADNVLSGMRQCFQQSMIQRSGELDDKIVQAQPEYNRNKCRYICSVAGNAILGTSLVGGLTLIGLFSWVIDHCHHAWD
jgi:hypothetical protein